MLAGCDELCLRHTALSCFVVVMSMTLKRARVLAEASQTNNDIRSLGRNQAQQEHSSASKTRIAVGSVDYFPVHDPRRQRS